MPPEAVGKTGKPSDTLASRADLERLKRPLQGGGFFSLGRYADTLGKLDENDSDVHRILAAVGVLRNDLEKAAFHQRRALALNPNDDLIVVQQAWRRCW